ncbi:MAG: hypothetical protein IJA46_03030 [Bacteroidaceae bacterium]|nr:hypothetical protein [Bacteroidaceae bacterium]
MKLHQHLFHCLLVAFMSLATIACNSDDDSSKNPESPSNPETPPSVKVEVTMKDAFVEGTVKDTSGNPLEAVTITSGDITTNTDKNGNFSMNKIADASGRFVLKFTKNGYFTITRSGVFNENLSISVVMQPKGDSNTLSTTFSSTADETLEAEGMQVDIPASSLVTPDGKEYTGTVQADMLYLSPDNDNFTEMMPGGDLAAVRSDESDAMLISYGMVEVSLTDSDGNPLQLKEGEQSQMTFPIPESMKSNPPATIPLWYFDENAGLWIEEGEATLSGDVYVGNVNHFSWHNLDVPAERVTITGKVTDCKERPVSRVLVTVEQTSAITRSDGTYTVYVPEYTPVKVTVESKDYYNYSPEASAEVAGQPGGTTVRNVDLELPCLPVISGRVINTAGSLVIARIYCEYDINGKSTTSDAAYTNATTGEYSLRISPEASGPAILYIEPSGGETVTRGIFLDGEDLTVNIEINQMIDEKADNVVTIKDLDGNLLTAATVDPATAILILAPNALAYTATVQMCDEGTLIIGSETYDGSSSSAEDVSVAFYSITYPDNMHAFVCETGHVDIIERSETETIILVTADGKYTDASGVERDAIFTATLSGKVSYSTDGVRTNVTDWSSLKCGAIVPQLKVPIDLVAVINTMGMEIETLYYNGTRADAEAMQKILLDNGWQEMSADYTESGFTVVYMNANWAIVSIGYDENGLEAPDGNRYPISVVPMV